MGAAPSDRFLAERGEGLAEELKRRGLDSARVQARVKVKSAVEQKRTRRPGLPINDFFGFRVVVEHVGLLDDATSAVLKWAEDGSLASLTSSDYFKHPRAGGYRARHFDFSLANPKALGLTAEMGVEVQITTVILALVSNASHRELYTRKESATAEIVTELERLAADALRLDERLAKLSTCRD